MVPSDGDVLGEEALVHLDHEQDKDSNTWMNFPVPDANVAAERFGTRVQCLLLLAWSIALCRCSDDGEIKLHWRHGDVDEDGQIHTHTLRLRPSDSGPALSGPIEAIEDVFSSVQNADIRSKQTQVVVYNGEPSWTIRIGMKLEAGQLQLETSWLSDVAAFGAILHAHCTASICRAIIESAETSIAYDHLLNLTTYETEQLWRWNRTVPPNIARCMHELVAEQAKATPDAQAICAWDGDFTHSEVEEMSTRLALRLLAIGIGLGQVVPVCFEKSKWTVVAVLAVMKASGAILLMDPSQPKGRLSALAEQVTAKFILTSRRHAGLGSEIAPDSELVVIDEGLFSMPVANGAGQYELPRVPPSAILYLIFTSGSTGKPKGVIISHETYTSGALPRADAVGYNVTSRVLDFASYAFDVSIDSMLCTLVRGGCLCIPSDEDRVNDLSGAIRKFKITMANLTPSVARVLDSDIIPALDSLGLGGESVSAKEVNLWGKDTRVVIGYGPSECTVGCTINSSAATGRSYTNLGQGVGGVMWVVDPETHERLTPIGAVGELLVEGPIVGQGYLNDPEKTSAAFIENPSWLVLGCENVCGRHGRLYKTGDLVRYDPDGSGCVVFVGRKDTQVKLRGQRVELGEIEHQLRSHLPQETHVAAEVLKPLGKSEQPTLVAFIAEEISKQTGDASLSRAEPSSNLRKAVESLEVSLGKTLPVYMIPLFYIPVSHIPILVSGKTDRKRLQEFGSSTKLQNLSIFSKAETKVEQPSTEMERILLPLWTRTLASDEGSIGTNHHFFALGGDSISAMKLVTVAREARLSLTVADVFRNPVLKDMALVTSNLCQSAVIEVAPFSLLGLEAESSSAVSEAAKLCGVEQSLVEDLYPCTPLQEMLIAFSERTSGGFLAQRVADISHFPKVDDFKAAWDIAIMNSSVLRTRILQVSEIGLLQVVLKGRTVWEASKDLQGYLSKDKATRMQLASPLARYAIIDDKMTGKRYFVWTVHHALYDAWATPCIVERVERALKCHDTPRLSQMKHFVAYLQRADREASGEYWSMQLKGASGPQFPSLPTRTYLPKADAEVEYYVPLRRTEECKFTVPIIIRAAWALVASLYAATDDIVFGETLNGRNIPLPGAEKLEGPMITTVPVRVQVDRRRSIGQYLQAIQDEAIRMMPHEHLGLQNIRKLSSDAQLACEIKTGLNIQRSQAEKPIDSDAKVDNAFEFEESVETDPAKEALRFNSYPLLLVCSLANEGFRVLAGFDSTLISISQMKRMLAQFDFACQKLTGDQNVVLGDMMLMSDEELSMIWSWNRISQDSVNERVAELPGNVSRSGAVKLKHPDAFLWIVDPENYQRLMPIGATGEVLLEGVASPTDELQDPTWLTAGHRGVPGRRGRLSKTGDLAKYDGDGTIVIVGRKDRQIKSQGRTVDLNMVEHHLRRLLPSNVNLITLIMHYSSTSGDKAENTPDQFLLAFVSEKAGDEGKAVDLKAHGKADFSNHPPELLTQFSAQLAEVIAGINRQMSNVVPPFMIPDAFIPIEWAAFDRNNVKNLSETIPLQCIWDYKNALTRLTQDLTSNTQLNEKERILRQIWGEILKLESFDISVDDSFFALGADSIMAMKLVSEARRAGYLLSVAKIFQNMRLREMADVLEEASSAAEEKHYAPFSELGVADTETYLREHVRPAMENPTWSISDVLPVTDPQARDIDATIEKPRSAIQYTLMYLNKSIDGARLLSCCDQLVSRHEILRTIFVQESGQYRQVILETLPRLTTYVDIEVDGEDLDMSAQKLCNEDIENDFPLGSPFTKFFLLRGKLDEVCLVLRLSHAQYDGISLPELIRQLVATYEGREILDSPGFSSYIYKTREATGECLVHWRQLLAGSRLTIHQRGDNMTTSTFLTIPVDISGRPQHITMSTLLTAAWAVVLSRLSSTQDVTFGSVTSGRNMNIAGVERIMGPCYQYMPVRVRFDDACSNSELLDAVQNQIIESTPFSSPGFNEISRKCTEWPSDAKFFGSIVHHQDFDDFDNLPFADTSCRVDIANPHSESSRHWKVVSFPKNGEMHLGIVGDESEQDSIRARLAEMAKAIIQFIQEPQSNIVNWKRS